MPPLIIDGRTMVPLRFIGEALGAQVIWDEATSKVTYLAGSRLIELTVGQTEVLVGGRVVQSDTPPIIVSGRTMVPVRFVSRWLGAAVDWDADLQRVDISYIGAAQ